MQSYITEILKMENTEAVEGSSNEDDSLKGGVKAKGKMAQKAKDAEDPLNGLSAQETKKMIDRKLDKIGKNKRRKLGKANPSNMTEEEMIEEQRRLFANARDYISDQEEGVQMGMYPQESVDEQQADGY